MKISKICFPIKLGSECGYINIECSDGVYRPLTFTPNNLGMNENLDITITFDGNNVETKPHASIFNFAEASVEGLTIQLYVDDDDLLVVDLWEEELC